MKIEEYLNNFYAGTKNPSLDAMHYFMEELGHPEKSLKVLHIAGTNGKGSIVEMLSNILIRAGYKTGKMMSPHLIEYNERISINQEKISDEELEKLILELMPKVDKYNQNHSTKITLFELETTMAILYFYRNDCDFVVMETGLGGLYDCTNIVNSMVSIISSIGYDHMNILGNTLEEIATQKAGIIKKNAETIFVRQEENVNKIIENTCLEKNNILHIVEPKDIEVMSFSDEFMKFNYKNYKDIELPLKGSKQLQNAAICLECVDILKEKYSISDKAIKDGLKTVVHKGRFETLCQNPTMIFDGAHNEPAIANLRDTIQQSYKNSKKVFIISILQSKDYTKILEQILQEDAVFIFTSGNEEGNFVSKEKLYNLASKMVENKVFYKKELKEAIRFVQEEYNDCVIFVIGSFYVYGSVVKELGEKYDTN